MKDKISNFKKDVDNCMSRTYEYSVKSISRTFPMFACRSKSYFSDLM